MSHSHSHSPLLARSSANDVRVRRVLLIEGLANLTVLAIKAFIGFQTGSLTILGDALHSLSDVANNAVALFVMKIASAPPDRDHPYGHRKYETLAVFGLAMLLTVTAFEIGLRALTREEATVSDAPWVLPLLLFMLGVNCAIALWERRQARRLDSPILAADARHTFGDVLTSLVVIGGWIFTVYGWPWMDSVFAIAISLLIWWLAYGLFRDSVPILVDSVAVPPESLMTAVEAVSGVRGVQDVRSRHTGSRPAVDVTITVDPELKTIDAHDIANAVEADLRKLFEIEDVIVHVEPDHRGD